ncbi:hypothetical protein PFICI_08058 [Pestalotiopsis fici W106-1]|uniref:Enoyl reductase (ER) domain-containing protein n=1 Tax=Pestalotiopsis fici (strain W106-1 / CGMCC3.15140) TaxID=1229662 RepID=W3X3E4_PESFW|nr:uncharacterized protein PFICI_08058 [Pestalotiopsis fici W106-1]ETS80529.1 hypothetical protein PFICI_08058 [Pestalotiopsis fici W106-1]
MPTSKAIYLEETGELTVHEITETYTPTDEQSHISVKYSAINPADLRHYYMGCHSYVAGMEYIGPVVATGPNSPFEVGDVLFGVAQFGHRRPLHAGAHQDFLLAEPFMTYKVPPHIQADESEWPQAVGWLVGLRTALDALFNCMDFGLPGLGDQVQDPGNWVLHGVDPRGKSLLIWGASSSVGLAALQLARTAGFSPIFATASPHNHAALTELGATACFDYRSPTVVSEIQAAALASGKPLAAIFDAVTAGTGFAAPPPSSTAPPPDLSKSSPAIAKQCLSPGSAAAKNDAKLCASLGVGFDPDWAFCLAARDQKETPLFHQRLETGMTWVLDHVREIQFTVPQVRIIKGAEEGCRMIKEVFQGKISMEKVVIQHPM